jgi:transposase
MESVIMDQEQRYAKILASIKGEPEYKRKWAEERFILIKEFLSDFEKTEAKRRGEKISRRQAIIAYCSSKNLLPATFTRWLQNYLANGIKGLIPAFGNRKGCSPYTKDILPILAEIIKPGESVGKTYSRLIPICEQLGITPPSKKTVERELKASGFVTTKSSGHIKTTVKLELEIDTLFPLACLQQLATYIDRCAAISQPVKDYSLKRLGYLIRVESRRTPLSLSNQLTDDEIKALIKYRSGLHKNHNAKATAILMTNGNSSLSEVVNATGRGPATIMRWIKRFDKERLDSIEVKYPCPDRQKRIEQRSTRIIDIIHTPPNTYGINRTTWTYDSITNAYLTLYHEKISKKTVERTVKQTGYTWRRTRRVQTSHDPDYKAKVEQILDTLQGLKPGERFFFIDEVGPCGVRKYGGKVLMQKDEIITVPEHQKSRGKIQFSAALEATTNQLTWVFTDNKTANSMIGLLEKVARDYVDCPAAFLTWDAITMHNSKAVLEWIANHNATAMGPQIKVVPLPPNAQYLNVIEGVFGGMKKAVVCNSDYATPHDMQEAISRHFEERNQFYKDNPRRAGNKIWDKQKFDFDKLAGGLFKRM